MTEINSPQNSHFRLWKSLLDSRGIKKEGLFLLSGRKIVPEVLARPGSEIVAVLSDQKSDHKAQSSIPIYLLDKPLFAELDVLGTKNPLLVIKTPSFADWNSELEPKESELLLGLGDPANLGAVLRSSLAFGVTKVILLKECAHPFLPKVLKTSAGAVLNLQFLRGPSIQDLKIEKGICLDLDGEDIHSFAWPKTARLLLGEEGKGIPEHLRLTRVKIPMAAGTESLNAVVAASIALYEWQSQFR